MIATRNRHEPLARSLTGLTQQTCDDFRVIVVDDQSDVSVEALVNEARFDQLDPLVIRLPQQSGPAAARNAGVEACTSEHVIFLDDDVVPDPRLVQAHLAAVRERRVDGAPVVSFGPFVQPADWDATLWNLWEARQAKKEADALERGDYEPTWRQCHTGNNCMPVRVFREIGGFNADFKRAEDDELALRLDQYGCHFHYEPTALAWHYSHRSLEAWLAIPRAYAQFDVEIDRLHPDSGHLMNKQRELGQRRFPIKLVRLVFRGARGTRVGVKLSILAARLLAGMRQIDLSMGALSVAYDLSYGEALSESLSAGGHSSSSSSSSSS